MTHALVTSALLLCNPPAQDRLVGQTVGQLADRATQSVPPPPDAAPSAERATGDERTTKAEIRAIVRRGLTPSDGRTGSIGLLERNEALAALAALTTPSELACALEVLSGEGSRPNLFATDAQVRRAIFTAMAAEPEFGQPKLIEFAVRAEDHIRDRAADMLSPRLSGPALAELAKQLGSDRELWINRAAMIAGSHPAAALIPALVTAQYAPPTPRKGDEAWIAIGKTVHYVQNAIPIVSDSSTSFQPVIGTVYEGSLLRVMESMVEIFRTEVHESLAMVIEHETGQPPPPFGYDRDRWMAWLRTDFPRLAEAHRRDLEQKAHEASARSTRGARDS